MTVGRTDIRPPMPEQTTLNERILDQALELAEATSWESVRLHAVADALHISLEDVRRCYAQKDDLVEAWFDRADRAVLSISPSDEDAGHPDRERLERAVMTWLTALSAHRRITRQMLMYKLEPGHFHLQLLGLMRISRTVQWLREAARLEATGWRRIFEEMSLSKIYLATFSHWLFDDSAGSEKTRALLVRLLRYHERCRGLCGNLRRPPDNSRVSGTQQTGF